MPEQLDIVIPTDQLWNKRDYSQRYPRILSRVDPEQEFNSVYDIAGKVKYENENGEMVEVVPSRKKHRLTNFFPIEKESEDRVKIRGLCLYEQTDTGTYQMSDEGKTLRRRYQDDEDWDAFLSELICKYFLRARTLLHYITTGVCDIRHTRGERFTGDQSLKTSDFEYTYYWSSKVKYDGAYTVAGLIDALSDEEAYDQEKVSKIGELYTIEYEAVASNFVKHRDHLSELNRIRERLHELVDSEQPSTNKLDDIHNEATDLLERVSMDEAPTFEYHRAPNLLMAANIEDILDPFVADKIEASLSKDLEGYDRIRITSAQNEEPLGGNIINVTNWALAQLHETGVLTHVDEGKDYQVTVDPGKIRGVISDEVAEELLSDLDSESSYDILEEIRSEVRERRDETGFVLWGDVRNTICQRLGLEEDEFKFKVKNLIEINEITVIDRREGIRLDPDGPPGHEKYPRVKLEL